MYVVLCTLCWVKNQVNLSNRFRVTHADRQANKQTDKQDQMHYPRTPPWSEGNYYSAHHQRCRLLWLQEQSTPSVVLPIRPLRAGLAWSLGAVGMTQSLKNSSTRNRIYLKNAMLTHLWLWLTKWVLKVNIFKTCFTYDLDTVESSLHSDSEIITLLQKMMVLSNH